MPKGFVQSCRENSGAPPRGTRATKSDSSLAAYLQSMGAHPTFPPPQERQKAEQLWTTRCQRWAALLSYPPLVSSMRALIDARLEVDGELAPLLERLERAAEEFRRSRTSANEAHFRELCGQAGAALVDVDTDGKLAEVLVADVAKVAQRERDGLTLAVARLPSESRPFRLFHEAVSSADTRLRRFVDHFARANLRLVVTLARRLARGRLSMQDAIQEGNLGLLKAIDRFDHRKGFRFSTYASWWIRHAISRAIYNKARQVRLPVHVHDTHHKIARTRRRYEAEYGREPSLDELASETGVPRAKIEKVTALELGPIISLDAPVSPTNTRMGVDLIEDEDESIEPSRALESFELEGELHEALSGLQPMELDILRRRYGLDGVEEETLQSIGERYALSRERIRQLQEQAVGRVRETFDRAGLL